MNETGERGGEAAETIVARHQGSHYAVLRHADRFYGVALDDLPFDPERIRTGSCRRSVHQAASRAEVEALIDADPWAWSTDPLPPVFHRGARPAAARGDGREPVVDLRGAVVSVPVRPAAETVKRRLIHGIRGEARRCVALLRQIDLAVRPGERVGIVGRNGSGKTTLLKAVAGIYPLAEGSRHVVGSIAPVIAQGIGFDHELSAATNIKLALAHMGRLEAWSPALQEAILDFAELGHRAHLPVQLLSSGQQARLAFAVTLFQTPDILILDEIFATGDEAFLRRATAAMTARIRTTPIVFLVSHNLAPIEALCTRCLMLAEGRIAADGPTADVLDLYRRTYRGAA
ncbi:ABC transporter ATP-binding protein [Desertibaculum subflavum]|uniref:ABC transporter ATP-binding protein n=1 Tax=Desertibaculum subflavum TaxID=2268458 RepID=UPI000E6616EA